MSFYASKKFKERMDEYQQKKGIKNRSELLRKSFEVYEKVFPLNPSDAGSSILSIEDRLVDIQRRLEEITVERKIADNEEKMLNNREEQLYLEDLKLSTEVSNLDPEEIPDFEIISEKILEFIDKSPGNSVKDFVLMDYFRKFYDEAIVWVCLVKLRNYKKLCLENGVWKRYEV